MKYFLANTKLAEKTFNNIQPSRKYSWVLSFESFLSECWAFGKQFLPMAQPTENNFYLWLIPREIIFASDSAVADAGTGTRFDEILPSVAQIF